MNRNSGFTLIELIVVIAVISLLSSIVLASLQNARERAIGIAYRISVDEFIKAVELYRESHDGSLPMTATGDHFSPWMFIVKNDGTIRERSYLFPYSTDNYSITTGIILSDGGYLKKTPTPPFRDGGEFELREGDSFPVTNASHIQCKNKSASPSYLIIISGATTIKYFKDWNSTMVGNNVSLIEWPNIKCYSPD